MKYGDRLPEKVAFDAPPDDTATDAYGNPVGEWRRRHSCRAVFLYAGGGEAVQAARLEGRGVYKCRIRSCHAARSIAQDWRLIDLRRDDAIYNIREVDAITDPAWVYLVIERGVAA